MAKRGGKRGARGRREAPAGSGDATRAQGERRATGDAELALGMDSPRERLTRRVFVAVEVALVAVPFVYLGASGLLGADLTTREGLSAAVGANPLVAVGLVTSFIQVFVAYLLRFSYRHYERGDAGYAAGNLVGLLCAEMLMQNVAGIAGIAVLLWRTWRRSSADLRGWVERRGPLGVLADISGSLVVLVLAAVCAFALWRVNG